MESGRAKEWRHLAVCKFVLRVGGNGYKEEAQIRAGAKKEN